VTLEGEIKDVSYDDVVRIPCQAKHRISNPGPDDLVFVETQTGSSFEEADIVRYEDDYGRAAR
jgi:mannose-6-phosphate isomerase-like protein (cupin superfamily)